MKTIRSEIGALAPIFAFEAAARLCSFTAAADELGVTQAAVSKQIAALEERLGVLLFTRLHRRVELTSSGQRLFGTTHTALRSIATTMQEIRIVDRRTLTVALSTSLSRFWLIPLMPAFSRDHPELAIRIMSQDELGETKTTGADLVLRYGIGNGNEGRAIPLFRAVVLAMASPEFLERYPVTSAEDVLQAPRIYYDTPNRTWISWDDWKTAAGLDLRLSDPALSLTRYHDAIVAAQQGQGIVLVWKVLDGRGTTEAGLVPVPGPEIPAKDAFYLVPISTSRPETKAAVEWFRLLAFGGSTVDPRHPVLPA